MKRYIIALTALALVLVFAGCTKNDNNTSSPGASTPDVVSDIAEGVSSMASAVEDNLSSMADETQSAESGMDTASK